MTSALYVLATGVATFVVAFFLVKYVVSGGEDDCHVVEHRQIEDEVELELSDGRVFRSEHGIVWYGFPSGVRVNYDLESWLGYEWDRLERLDKWSESTRRENQ